jgi:hypothetical protein
MLSDESSRVLTSLHLGIAHRESQTLLEVESRLIFGFVRSRQTSDKNHVATDLGTYTSDVLHFTRRLQIHSVNHK